MPMEHPSVGGSPAIPIRRATDDSSGSGRGRGSGLGGALGAAGRGSSSAAGIDVGAGGVGGAIAIPSSYRDESRLDESSSDGESDGVNRENFLSGSYSHLGGDGVLDDLDGTAAASGTVIVGSLPSSRYERRRAAANSGLGGGGGGGAGGALHGGSAAAVTGGTARSLGHGGEGDMSLSRSLPPPRAPWLHAKTLSQERLSRVPQIALPESALESTVPSSLPYGSLRESKFGHYHQRGARPPPGGGPQRTVRFKGDSPKTSTGGANAAEEGAAAVPGTAGLYPSSLPAYTDAGSELARRRWEKEAAAAASPEDGIVVGPGKAGPSPLALGIGGGIGSPSAGAGGGIGAAIGNSPPMHGSSSSIEGAVGSLASQLGGLPPPSGGGIGEALEGTVTGNRDYGGEEGAGHGNSSLYDTRDRTSAADEHYDGEGSNSMLSSSLTALNILESTPGLLGVASSAQEMQPARSEVAVGGGMPHTTGTGLVHQQLGTAPAPYAAAPPVHGLPHGYPAGIPPDLDVRSAEEPDHFEAFDLELED